MILAVNHAPVVEARSPHKVNLLVTVLIVVAAVILLLPNSSIQIASTGGQKSPITTTSAGSVYFVSPVGKDSNPGTEGLPWRTIQKAADVLQAGDTVYIKGGTYHEMVVPMRSGTEGEYITYRNYGGDTVVISADDGARMYGIYVRGKAYLQFVGLTLEGSTGGSGFYAEEGANHIVVEDVRAYHNRFGIRFKGRTVAVSDVTLRNCDTSNNLSHGIFLYEKIYGAVVEDCVSNNNRGEPGNDAYGMEVSTTYPGAQENGARNVTIRDNEFAYNAMQGIRTWNAVGVLIQGNHTHHNDASGIQLEDGTARAVVENNLSEDNARSYTYETGIWAHESVDVVIQRNIVRRNQIGMLVTGSTGILVRNNLIYDNNYQSEPGISTYGIRIGDGDTSLDRSQDIAVVHNTFWGNSAQDLAKGTVTVDSGAGTLFRNNIVSQSGGSRDLWVDANAAYRADGNVYYNDRPINVYWRYTDFPWWPYVSASGQETHSVVADPLLVNPSEGDFRLQVDSPAIDRGDFLTATRSAGSGMSIPVADARYFSDGFGLVGGDQVVVGANDPVTVAGIDHGANTIRVDRSISWDANATLSYPFSGATPDSGAYECTTSGCLPTPVTAVAAVAAESTDTQQAASSSIPADSLASASSAVHDYSSKDAGVSAFASLQTIHGVHILLAAGIVLAVIGMIARKGRSD